MQLTLGWSIRHRQNNVIWVNVFVARNTFLYLPSGWLLINKNKKTKLQILLLLWNSCEEFKDLNQYCYLKSDNINSIIKVGESIKWCICQKLKYQPTKRCYYVPVCILLDTYPIKINLHTKK